MSKINTLTLGFANALLINDKGAVLVDTGINVSREKYLSLFRELNQNPLKINLIIISHGHADHYSYANELKEITGAPILCHKNAVHALETAGTAGIVPRNELGESVFKMIKGMLPKASKPVTPDIIMDCTMDLSQYGISGKIIHTPGHTDCSISIILESGEAIVGDMLVPSFITGEPCLAYFATNEKALFQSLRTVLDQAHTFYGCHGGPFTKEEILNLAKAENIY